MIYNESKFNSEWDTLPLFKLGDFKRGKSKHRPRNDIRLFKDGKYPLVQTGEIKAADLYITSHNAAYNDFGLKQSQLWDAGTLCITIAANIAETGILAYPMCFPDSIVGFTADKSKTSELFMHYVFSYIRRKIQNSALGSIQDNINIELLTSLDFKIPNIDIQDKIVDLLSTLDDKISLNNRINAELEQMARTLYNYWFVQFDFPISAPLAASMGKLELECKPYRSSGGAMVWNEELKREVPRGWEVGKLEEFANITTGKLDSNQVIEKGTYPFFTCAPEPLAIDTFAFDDSVILIAGNNASGNFHINRFKGKFNAYQRTYVVTSKSHFGLDYLYYALSLELKNLKDKGQGSQTKFLTMSILNEICIYRVKEDVLRMFNDIINPLFEKQNTITMENQELTRLRDFLLPLLMNGQVRVSE